jgi:hypothetical protein
VGLLSGKLIVQTVGVAVDVWLLAVVPEGVTVRVCVLVPVLTLVLVPEAVAVVV